MFTKTPARKNILPYMAESWQYLEKVFYKNLEKEANGQGAKWINTPSLEAIQSWKNILKRNGIKN